MAHLKGSTLAISTCYNSQFCGVPNEWRAGVTWKWLEAWWVPWEASASTDLSSVILGESLFLFTINLTMLMFLAVPRLLYVRLHCLSVGRHYLHDLTDNCAAILETCDPWDMWSKWQPDLTNQPTFMPTFIPTPLPGYLPTYLPTTENSRKKQF